MTSRMSDVEGGVRVWEDVKFRNEVPFRFMMSQKNGVKGWGGDKTSGDLVYVYSGDFNIYIENSAFWCFSPLTYSPPMLLPCSQLQPLTLVVTS